MLALEVISVPHHSINSQPGVVAIGFSLEEIVLLRQELVADDYIYVIKNGITPVKAAALKPTKCWHLSFSSTVVSNVPWSPFLFVFNLFFYWRIITFQNFVVFCQTSIWITIGIHISPPFWNSLPSPSPSHLSRLIQSPCLSFQSHTANSLMFPCHSFHTSHPLLLSPHVHKSILYVCFSVATL